MVLFQQGAGSTHRVAEPAGVPGAMGSGSTSTEVDAGLFAPLACGYLLAPEVWPVGVPAKPDDFSGAGDGTADGYVVFVAAEHR